MMSCTMMTCVVTLVGALWCCAVMWCEGIRSDIFLSTAETSELLASEKGLLTFVHHCLTQTATSTGNTAFNSEDEPGQQPHSVPDPPGATPRAPGHRAPAGRLPAERLQSAARRARQPQRPGRRFHGLGGPAVRLPRAGRGLETPGGLPRPFPAEAEEMHVIYRKHAHFFSLCQHFQNSNDVMVMRSERCEYGAGGTPLNRWKREVLSADPYVVLVYDFVTDREADIIVDKAMNRLTQALTGLGADRSVLKTQRRLGKIAWMRSEGSTVLSSVTRRIHDVTGLPTAFRPTASFGEHFQVVNYGIGGHYIPHYDYFQVKNAYSTAEKYLKDSGDRAATFMIYLGNVTRGGATVFPHLGIGAPPIKNAALFWYNFTPDGNPDPRSQHGGCPVIIGEKWVTNKWIHEISTAMTKTCQTTPWRPDNT